MRQKRKKALRSVKNIEGLIGRRHGLDAHIAYQLDAGLLKEFLEPRQFKQLDEAVGKCYVDWESNVAAARLMAQDIEGLLSQSQVERAYDAYQKAQETFDRYLDNDKAIDDLEKKTRQAYDQFRKKKRWASSFIRQVQWLMEHKQGDQAFAQFKKARPELYSCVDPKQLTALDSAVARSNRKYEADKALAEKNAIRIRMLIDQKRFEDAYTIFTTLRKDLEAYLPDASFTGLRNEVTSAFDEYKAKKKKAEDYAKQLQFLLDRKKLQEARTDFQSNRAALKQYLSAADFSKLEKAILGKTSNAKAAPIKRK